MGRAKLNNASFIQLPDTALQVIGLLGAAGFETYAVGGVVRDSLLGRPVHDIDLTTKAFPQQVRQLAEAAGFAVFDTGLKHGTVTVIAGGNHYEVTTFREDGPYADGRHPDSVTFAATVEKDLSRRDFSINAMAFSPAQGLVDPFNGQRDLQAKIIRCVGVPQDRFEEDALRILRALRFAAQLGFALEDKTAQAVHQCKNLLQNIARERIEAEFSQLICGSNVQDVLLEFQDVIGVIIPQLAPEFGFDQHNQHHVYDVWKHSVVACSVIEPQPVLRYAALLHDIGKPSTYTTDEAGVGHFYNHAQVGEPIARDVCNSLRLPKEMTSRICVMVLHHGDGFLPERRNIQRWMRKIGPDAVRDILKVKRADVSALNPIYADALPIFDEIEAVLDAILADEACFKLKDLAINGHDLIETGIAQGPHIGHVLNVLLDRVVEGELPNEREALLKAAHHLKA